MNTRIPREDQPAATHDAIAALIERQSDSTRPPETGDVFLSRRTADFPVEWLVVESGDGRVRVMPLDDHPYIGNRDLELTSQSLGGPGVLRCGLEAWLDASDLESELRTATLSAPELADVRRKLDETEPRPTLLEEEVDGDPIYRRWRDETLTAAVAALTDSAAVTSSDEAVSTPAASERWNWRPVLLAASVALAVAGPAGWWVNRLDDQLDAEKARLAALEADRDKLQDELASSEAGRQAAEDEATALEATLAEARKIAERTLDEQQKRFTDRLRRAFDDAVVVNPPFFSLGKEARTRSGRGQPDTLAPGDAKRMTLSLEIIDPAPYTEGYRVEIVTKSNGEELWSTDGLVPARGRWLRLDFPTSLFEAEEYEIRLYGLKNGAKHPLAERYTVVIVF